MSDTGLSYVYHVVEDIKTFLSVNGRAAIKKSLKTIMEC